MDYFLGNSIVFLQASIIILVFFCLYLTIHLCFSYICDDFVINDTESGYLGKLRKHLESISQLACHPQR